MDVKPSAAVLRARPTPEGGIALWFAVVFAVGALSLGENLVFLLGCLLLGTAASTWWFVRRNLSGLEVARNAPARTRVGVPTTVEVEVRNRRRGLAMGVEVEDHPDGVSRPASIRLAFDGVPGRGSACLAPEITFARRGLLTLGGVTLSSRYPLGVFRAARRVAAPMTILVRPREGRATALLRTRLRGRAAETALRSSSMAGDEALYGVREFREGDDPRRIHWRTTARRGVTTVTEWRSQSGRRVVLVLGRAAGTGGRGHRAFERAVSCAATVWRALRREGLPANLVVPGVGREIESGARGLEAGLDALARVRGRGGRAERDPLAALAGRRGPRCVVYVGSGGEPGLSARLRAAAGKDGETILLRCDLPGIARFVRGLP